MKILITDLFGIMAGSTYSAVYLAEGLVEAGHQVWVAYRPGSFLGSLLTNPDIKKVPIKSKSKWNLVAAVKLSRLVRSQGIQIVNCQASPDRYLTIFAKKWLGMPTNLIHTRRQKPETTGGALKAKFYTWGTDKMIAVSPAVKEYLVSSGIPKDHIKVIPNGIPELKWMAPDNEAVAGLRHEYEISEGNLVIGCVSRIKQQDQILKAIKEIDQPVTVLFVGIADEYPHLTKLIGQLPTRHRVFFTGEIANHQALNYYALFTVKVLPSVMEGFSQSLLEAMVQGVPVIATDASGNPDLISHGENGFLFEDNDIEGLRSRIEEVYTNAELRAHIIQTARKQVEERYSMSAVIRQYEEFYEELITN